MTTSRYLSEALRGLAQDVRDGHSGEYHASKLEQLAGEIDRLQARDLIGTVEVPQWR